MRWIVSTFAFLLFSIVSFACYAGADEEKCLECHDSAALIEKAPYIKDNTNEKILINPHKFVPHDSKILMKCTQCHEKHDETTPDVSKIAKADVKACFSCHHSETFKNCSECHFEE